MSIGNVYSIDQNINYTKIFDIKINCDVMFMGIKIASEKIHRLNKLENSVIYEMIDSGLDPSNIEDVKYGF